MKINLELIINLTLFVTVYWVLLAMALVKIASET